MPRDSIARTPLRLVLLAGVAQSLSCSEPAPPPIVNAADSVHAVVMRVDTMLKAGSYSHACGDPVLHHKPPESVLVVSAWHCWPCSDLGFLGRRLGRAAMKQQTGFWIVTSLDDTAKVCGYAREERVRAPVVAVPDDVIPDERVINHLVFFRTPTEADTMIVFHSLSGLEIHRLVQSVSTAGDGEL